MGAGLSLILYGLLLALGGWAAYKRDKNELARNIGGFFGVLILVCGAISWLGYTFGATTGLVITLLMALLFTMRYRKTKKIRPAGFMMVVSYLIVALTAYFRFVA